MADDGDFVFRNQLRTALARLGEEQQRLDDEVPLPLPDPEEELRRLIDEILATAERVLAEPFEPAAEPDDPATPDETMPTPSRPPVTIAVVDPDNAGWLIVENAVEELASACADLLLVRRRPEYLRAASRLLRSAWTLAPYHIGATPGTTRTVLGQEQKREQAHRARIAKQHKARARPEARAFRDAIEKRLREGTALAELRPKMLRDLLPGMTPRMISRRLQDYKENADNATEPPTPVE